MRKQRVSYLLYKRRVNTYPPLAWSCRNAAPFLQRFPPKSVFQTLSAPFNYRMLRKEYFMKKTKQILAIIGIVVILALYIATLIFAVFDIPGRDKLFLASAFCTVLIPVLLYIYLWIYKVLKK